MNTYVCFCLTLFSTLFTLPGFASTNINKPKLIVQLTVDQLRGDLPKRYQKHFIHTQGKQGFNRFLRQGLLYQNTHYRHASTKTAVGHATLATGSLPSQHGVIGNHWFDQGNDRDMYCVEDPQSQLLNEEGYSASPKNLLASTFSDELHMATNGRAKIYAVSIKDRGAVLTAGRFGKAYWYSKNTGNMVTSDYYHSSQPGWLTEFNQQGYKDNFVGKMWQLSKPEQDYINGTKNRLFQIPAKGFSQGFPHQLAATKGKRYYKSLAYTPFGDQLTAEFAKHLVTQHQLGQDDVTDYLSISFSVNDSVGHQFGPYSREAEDNLIRLDQTFSDLFQFLDKKVGSENLLLVLSADHGVDAIPEYKKSLGFVALRGNTSANIRALEKQAQQEFDTQLELISAIKLPNIYLAEKNLKQANINQKQMEHWFIQQLKTLDTVAEVIPARQLSGQAFADPILDKVQNSYYQGRSGQLILVQKSSTLFNAGSAASHGSPYRYDTHVPLYFSGLQLDQAEHFYATSPEDLAVTLSALLRIPYPDKATGQVLAEVLQ